MDSVVAILSMLVIGASGMIAQVIVLRECWLSFFGNELTLGIMLTCWLALEAAGVVCVTRLLGRIRHCAGFFIVLQTCFVVSVPTALYAARTIKPFLGIAPTEAMGLAFIIAASAAVMGIVAFCHGGLFGCGWSLFGPRKDFASTLGAAYGWETLGTIAGGFFSSYYALSRPDPFETAYWLVLPNLLLCLTVAFRWGARFWRTFALCIVLVFACVLWIVPSAWLQVSSLSRQYPGQMVLEYRNSVYGNAVATQRQAQRSFYYNGMPVITVPHPNRAALEEFANLPLAMNARPRNVLVIGAGAGGLLAQVLQSPLERVEYLELDPLIVEMVERHPSALTARELADPRVRVIFQDSRYFMRQAGTVYDVVLVGLTQPLDLTVNRLFTEEFLRAVRLRLAPDGVLALRLPGSEAYQSPVLDDLNRSVYLALRDSYGDVRVIPGDLNTFIASVRPGISGLKADEVQRRMRQRNIAAGVLTVPYLAYRLGQPQPAWATPGGSRQLVNRDLRPRAVFQMLMFWDRQFSLRHASLLTLLPKLKLRWFLLILMTISAVFVMVVMRVVTKGARMLAAQAVIATTGFYAMGSSIVFILAFQVLCGYLYQQIGVLIALQMSGIALGSLGVSRLLMRRYGILRSIVVLEATMALLAFAAAMIMRNGIPGPGPASIVIGLLLFVTGCLAGAEFPLASGACAPMARGKAPLAGRAYALDLFGGALAGLCVPVWFIPIWGAVTALAIAAFLKILGAFLMPAALWGSDQTR